VIDRESETTVLLRAATCADAAALERIAQLDSNPLPAGPHLVAERAGRIEAAISLATSEIVANPFVRTAELCDLLRLHAESARAAGPAAQRGRGLRPRLLGATT
jgi:hypothetical protein